MALRAMSSRDLNDLTPELQAGAERLLIAAEHAGLDLLIYCTFRDMEEQARLFRRGRSWRAIHQKIQELTNKGRPDLATLLADVGPQHEKKIVTWAGPGESPHNYGEAWDAVPMRDGRPVWGTKEKEDRVLWYLYGELIEDQGLEWGGNWIGKEDFPHAQLAGFDSNEKLKFGVSHE